MLLFVVCYGCVVVGVIRLIRQHNHNNETKKTNGNPDSNVENNNGFCRFSCSKFLFIVFLLVVLIMFRRITKQQTNKTKSNNSKSNSNNKRQTTDNRQQTTDNRQQTTNNKQKGSCLRDEPQSVRRKPHPWQALKTRTVALVITGVIAVVIVIVITVIVIIVIVIIVIVTVNVITVIIIVIVAIDHY